MLYFIHVRDEQLLKYIKNIKTILLVSHSDINEIHNS